MSKSKEFRVFERLTDQLLAVPRDVLNKRMARYREQVEQNQKRRGPKRKAVTKPSADRDEGGAS